MSKDWMNYIFCLCFKNIAHIYWNWMNTTSDFKRSCVSVVFVFVCLFVFCFVLFFVFCFCLFVSLFVFLLDDAGKKVKYCKVEWLHHEENIYGAIPSGHSVHLKEKYGYMKLVLDSLKYDEHNWTLTPRRLRPTREANKTQTRDPLNFGPCKADWPAAFVIK